VTTLEYLLTNISEEITQIETNVARGAAKDYAEYQYLCGKIRGLLVAEDIIKALQDRLEKDDE
jgi:hypothetical protein